MDNFSTIVEPFYNVFGLTSLRLFSFLIVKTKIPQKLKKVLFQKNLIIFVDLNFTNYKSSTLT